MLDSRRTLLALALLLAPGLSLCAVDTPIVVQAENGTLGADFTTLTANGVTYITSLTDFAATDAPGNATKVASYSVTFPAAGTYHLYVRVRVGAGGANDDSFYYGNGFGAKAVADGNDWIQVNNFSGVGFSADPHWVTAQGSTWGDGGTGSGTWKWLQLSSSNYNEAGVAFVVPDGALTQTFEVGTRENGLDIDQFAFGRSDLYFTVAHLNAGTAGTTTPPPPPGTPTGPALAVGKPKFLGGVSSPAQDQHLLAFWNQVAPENAGKWGSVEGTRDVMNWTQLDTAYQIAKSNGLPFRFHVLIWGNQQPAWIESLPPAEQLEEIQEWFEAVAARYPDMEYVEVVNEPLHDPPDGAGDGNYINALGGSGASGWDWVLNAFRMARPLFPNSKLVLNEYSVVNDGPLMASYVNMINLLKAENLVDIVAEQAHSFSTANTGSTTITNNLNTLAATGLPIMITEMDIDGAGSTAANDALQLERYQRIFPLFWEHPAVMGVTMWGYRPGLWRPNSVLLLADNTERSALEWLRTYVAASNPPLNASLTAHPTDVTKLTNEDATFTVGAAGNPAPAIQWQRSTNSGTDWSDVVDDATFSGAATATLTITSAKFAMTGHQFRAVASNGHNGSLATDAATLTVNKRPVTVTFDQLTQPFTGAPLSPVAISSLSGPSVNFDYTFNGSAIVPTGAGNYAVVATVNDPTYAGSGTDTFTILPVVVVNTPPAITTQVAGATTLTVTASTGTTPTYQWQWQPEGGGAWTDIPGATEASHIIQSMQSFLAGNYRAVVTAGGASTASDATSVDFTPLAPSANARLLNLSTRALCQTGDNVLIPGFVITGTGTKRLLIRAVGPTLAVAPFNFGDAALPNPRMTLRRWNFATSAYDTVETNDDWGTNANAAEIVTTSAELFAFALTQAQDAALLLDLPPGQYTVVAEDTAQETGIAIVELYDADPATPTSTLVNISNRGFAGVGAEVVIPGFVVSPDGPKTFLIRVVGPTLAGFGVPGTMVDPKLTVNRGATQILTQDDWGSSPEAATTAQIAAQVSAFALVEGSKDAAFVVTLPPGGYTIIGSAADGVSTGVVLVEVYVVP